MNKSIAMKNLHAFWVMFCGTWEGCTHLRILAMLQSACHMQKVLLPWTKRCNVCSEMTWEWPSPKGRIGWATHIFPRYVIWCCLKYLGYWWSRKTCFSECNVCILYKGPDSASPNKPDYLPFLFEKCWLLICISNL